MTTIKLKGKEKGTLEIKKSCYNECKLGTKMKQRRLSLNSLKLSGGSVNKNHEKFDLIGYFIYTTTRDLFHRVFYILALGHIFVNLIGKEHVNSLITL